MTRLYVPLSKHEWLGLLVLAQRESRSPKDILRNLLQREIDMGNNENVLPTNANSVVTTRQGSHDAVAA